ncbi:MAG: hypothetical protein J7577_00915 [Sphingobacteriaceae bacterium]|nr:hypothetical protein [Sphingobacteriaceae bacterium]
MASFDVAYKITLGHEGGYVNDPDDTGGETIFGVTRRDWPKSPIWPRVDLLKKQYGLSKAIPIMNSDAQLLAWAKDLFKKNYWDVNNLDRVSNQSIANEVFDTGVNMGIGTAARFLQRGLNATNRNQVLYKDVAVDGAIGNGTLAVLNSHPNTPLLYKVLNVLQGARYIDIMESNSKQEKFAVSWFSRVKIN